MSEDKQSISRRTLVNLAPPSPVREETSSRDVKTDWIPFFKGESQNIYINDLALRYRRCPSHAAVINSKHTYAIGENLTSNNQQALDNQKRGNTLRDVYVRVMFDWITYGNVWIEVDPRNKLLFWRDATQWRVGKNARKAYGSKFWPKIKEGKPSATYPVTEMPLAPEKSKNYLVRMFRQVSEYEVYGLPDHTAALNWADIEYYIVDYNRKRFTTGFLPSMYIGFIGEPPEGQSKEQYTSSFRDAFTGEDGYQKLITEWLETPEQRTIIERFEPRDGEFLEMQKQAVSNIITSHSWFASLSGLVIPGLLGDYKSLSVEYEAAMSGVVIPRYQKPVLQFLEQVLAEIGITAKLEVTQLSPLTLGDRIVPNEVLTINEQRAELNYDKMPDGDKLLERVNNKGTGN